MLGLLVGRAVLATVAVATAEAVEEAVAMGVAEWEGWEVEAARVMARVTAVAAERVETSPGGKRAEETA